MKVWKNSWLDSFLLLLSISQFGLMFIAASHWESFSLFGKIGNFVLLLFMMVYNIIVISHLFTHNAWFNSSFLNALVSMLNSINIGQSVQSYQLTHVRNHHLYNNDMKGPDKKTQDLSSTFQDGEGNSHASLFRYAFVGAIFSVFSNFCKLLAFYRLWRVALDEQELRKLLSRSVIKQAKELRQIQLDRCCHFLAIALFLTISWQWTCLCYLPAYYLALSFVNIQNYYEHYGAQPSDKFANSVSYYGQVYNFLAFNDGYHQEHHLRPVAHWSTMPQIRKLYAEQLDVVERIISPVPSIIGFLDWNRPMLHSRILVLNNDPIAPQNKEPVYD